MDKIYHLNIEQATGIVKMPILSEDWSEYLTLVTVFDTLDILLE
jgi:ubiquitin-protein ligase